MFDNFEPLEGMKKEPFTFYPDRFEIWKSGKLISSGKTTSPIIAEVIKVDNYEKVKINFNEKSLNREIANLNIFDEYRTSNDRLQLITLPAETNHIYQGFKTLLLIIGPTRQRKYFESNEPFCCNLFTINNAIKKVTFAFSNPEKLIEFYQDNDTESNDLELDFEYYSSDHLRYENGKHVAGPHNGAPRIIKVENIINSNECYTVTMFNTEGGQAVVQMSPKQMKLVGADNKKIQLKGYGHDTMGASFADYGLTIFHNDGNIEKCILHMYDRGVDIEYLR